MPHALTWPTTGDVQYTHPKPPEGGYYANWDPYAATIELAPANDVNPVRSQHVLIATVRDKDGKPLPNRRVEWIVSQGSAGDIVEVDESGWRASRGYKVDNHYAVSHTNNCKHMLDRGNSDAADDIHLEKGQTWCVITSPVEGDTYVTAYAPGIYDWSKHKAFATKHWYDVKWAFPPEATNPTGTLHKLTTKVMKESDGSPLAGYIVNYEILDGPAGTLDPGGGKRASVPTDNTGQATVTLKQAAPAEGVNNISIDIIRPEDKACCKPAAQIASGRTSKTWVGPKIAIDKSAPATAMVNETFDYNIVVTNPSQVEAQDVIVTDELPAGIAYVSSTPAAQVSGQALSWSLGKLAAGGKSSIAVKVKGTKTGKFENCAEVKAAQGLQARDCATTVITAPALTLEKQCPGEVLICDPIPYVLTVKNSGDGPARNVKITDTLPDGLTTEDGKTSVTVDVGTLNAGQSKQAKFNVTAKKTGTFENRATATADGGLTAEAVCKTVVKQPVLEVTKKGPAERYIGRPAEYEITVSNKGDAAARETVLTDTVPAGTEFTSASDGGKFASGVVTWSLGTLEPGATKKVTVTLKPTAPGTVKNTATAKAICAQASAEASMPIKGVPAVLLEVVDDPDPIEVGGTVTYTIVVTNQGSAEGTNIAITCTIPPEEDYISSDGPTKATVEGKTVEFAPLAKLDPKAKVTWKIVVKGTKTADVRFKTGMKTGQTGEVPVEETESTHIY